jgi:predicted RecB family nuclease
MQAALSSHKARIRRGPPAPPSSQAYRAASVQKAKEAKTSAHAAAYYHGHALVQEALKAAAALKWGACTGTTGSGPQRDLPPLTLHFKGGQRAVINELSWKLGDDGLR